MRGGPRTEIPVLRRGPLSPDFWLPTAADFWIPDERSRNVFEEMGLVQICRERRRGLWVLVPGELHRFVTFLLFLLTNVSSRHDFGFLAIIAGHR